MSGIAKGKAFISEEDLKNLLGIPEDVEIISLLHIGDGIEIKLASKEPTILTKQISNNTWCETRATTLPVQITKTSNKFN